MVNRMQDDEPGNVLAKDCPSRQILNHLTSRWGVLVLIVLKDKVLRFSDIRRAIGGISERMLAQTLQNLEADGMLIRHAFHTVPPRVEYRLSEFGQVAAHKVADLSDWLERNLPAILNARPDKTQIGLK